MSDPPDGAAMRRQWDALCDIPPELTEYEDAFASLNRVADFWHEGMRLPGWDWQRRGYPPGWRSGLGDRLRAGLFHRAR